LPRRLGVSSMSEVKRRTPARVACKAGWYPVTRGG
jgi:hypothetical protein